MGLIDSHTHLEVFARAGELPGVLDRARSAGVEAMITVGTAPDDWSPYARLAVEHRGFVHHTAGLHPCSVDAAWRSAVAELEAHLRGANGAVAVGETGLDRFHLPKDPARAEELFGWQREGFRAHLALAREAGLPVVVHSRGAAGECIALIDEAGFDWGRVVFHCFTDGPEVVAEIVRRGGRASFTGIATYKNAENIRRAALAQGIGRTMVETDAPYLAPEPHRGRRNEPAFVVETAAVLARVFGVTPAEFAETSTRAAREFFRLDG